MRSRRQTDSTVSAKANGFRKGLSWFAIFACVALSFASSSAHAGPWSQHLMAISKLKAEVDALEGEIKHMIHERRESHVESEVRELTVSIAEKYKALKESSDKLEEETTHIRFKHPEQADQLDRKYTRHHLKSLDDLASEVGIDGRLDRIKRKVAATFPTPEQKRAETEPPKINPFFRKPASLEEDSEAPEKIVLKK
jgi:hypothetical protein